VRATAVLTVLLILSASVICAHGTTLEDDLHIVHNLDNRSPEIDPFWYVGRGVRPIGRFGKRQSSSSLRPAVSHLELLLHSLRDKDVQSLGKILAGEDYDRLP
ncbi:prolactin releasing hormone 2, partial [Megalops cyprinoides]|uniref:prolactin releasing hormone 2 n=1 Tax=Megalops cyprinoides TaxID=118141 RepID=UPI001863DDDE